ncbi:MAG: DUF58 domain-containing protein, partial [Oscillospiraceae bacterium]|nr:DUF58 domain-containing protein [Oscillospiraceae bacterium]
TAGRRELVVRQYGSTESRRLLVALDLSPFTADDPEACEDALIEACLSVVRYAHERQIDTTFVYAQGKSLRSHAGRGARVFSEIHSEMAKVTFTADIPLLHLLDEAKRAQMVYLFCAKVPDGETLSALPQDKPVELAVVRTGKGKTPLPDSLEMMRVTELNP